MTAEAQVTEDDATTPLLATIRAAQGGDHRAFEELMIASQHRVAVLAWRILGDPEEVKEALQETFLRLFRHLGRYDEQHDFFAWLFRIAVNVCRDLQRRRRRRWLFLSLDDAPPLPVDNRMDETLMARDDVALLNRAIDALPRKERLTIILRDVEELETAEVARILGNTPATVRVQASKARAKVRKWVEAWRKGEKP